MTMKTIFSEKKQAYVKPICKTFYLENQSLMAGSVRSNADNVDVGGDPNDPWHSEED
ncbi:hypothetical protein JCM15754A_20210 [Prevotella aurantiaca JCM 15754]|uniref:hypothetical protein n=2 Tax=Prevotella aurantiaca TaxID=596085 RepID=UPI000A771E1D|nr:hypothetical protein [Prevotella aurantiaca]